MSGSSLGSGLYKINHVLNSNHLQVRAKGDPIISGYDNYTNHYKWTIDKLSNGRYVIQNLETQLYANSGKNAVEGGTMRGSDEEQQFIIKEVNAGSKTYTIAVPDVQGMYWHLNRDVEGEAVTLIANPGQSHHWNIVKIAHQLESEE